MAEAIGYKRFLVVVPYYNKPSQAGLLSHYRAIADAISEGEVVLYNVPSRTGISLTVESVVELASHPKIRAIKEASGDLKFLAELRAELTSKRRTLSLLSGDDLTYYPFLLAGGDGTISVASHVCPRALIELEAAAKSGDHAHGDRIQMNYLPIFRDLFIESNPGPLKWMLAKLELCENRLRLPLVPVGGMTEKRLEATLSQYRIEAGEFRK
jgi:4-hydroxy-tetrahydrodipicolinate synthase